MKYQLSISNRFKKDLKLLKKRGYNLSYLQEVIDILLEGKELDAKYHDHALHGDFEGSRECHIRPDWLLIYTKFEDKLLLFLSYTGTHSDLFR